MFAEIILTTNTNHFVWKETTQHRSDREKKIIFSEWSFPSSQRCRKKRNQLEISDRVNVSISLLSHVALNQQQQEEPTKFIWNEKKKTEETIAQFTATASKSRDYRRKFNEIAWRIWSCNNRRTVLTINRQMTNEMSSNSTGPSGTTSTTNANNQLTTSTNQTNGGGGSNNSITPNKNNDSSCSSSNTEDYNEIEERRRRIKNRSRWVIVVRE